MGHFHCFAKPGHDGRPGNLDSTGVAETYCSGFAHETFVIGKSWDWKNKEPYTFIKDLKQIEKELKSGKLLYKAAKQD